MKNMEWIDPGIPTYKGNLHMHTSLSDGTLSPAEAKEVYREKGYDFVAITDHRVRERDAHWHREMLVLPGIELDYTLPNQVMHILGIGVDGAIDQELPRIKGPQAAIHRIHHGGGFAVLAHPAWSLNTVESIMSLKELDAAEIYNAVSAPPFNGDRADSMPLLDAAAANGCLLNTIAADDSHWYQGEQGDAFIRLQARELTCQAVMEALFAGRYYASRGPAFKSLRLEGDTLHVESDPVAHIVVLSNYPYAPGRNFHGKGIARATYQVDRRIYFPETFLRVVLIDEYGRKAWSNPIQV